MDEKIRKYAKNKYIWEHESDKNSPAAQAAAKENKAMRDGYGAAEDTMNYNEFVSKMANSSQYYDKAKKLEVNPVYKRQSDMLYDAVNNFSYDAENDPAFKAYSDAANRQSAASQKNTYANLAKMSGGRNSSYASAAVAQVGQAYADKINDYAQTLAKEAYNKLLERYKLSNDNYEKAVEENDKLYDRYMKMGDTEVKNNRNALSDWQSMKKEELDMRDSDLDYKTKLDKYEAQLISNKILNEKNRYEYERWLEDPEYEIKDKKLAEEIGKYWGYKWLKNNGPDYLYSKFY